MPKSCQKERSSLTMRCRSGNGKKALIVLMVAAILLTSSCGAVKETSDFMKGKTSEFLDCIIRHDLDGLYALCYPDSVERGQLEEFEKQFFDYCPVAEGYELSTEGIKVNKTVGTNSADTITADYKLTFNGEVYYINAEYVKTSGGEGFKAFWVSSEEDHKAD